MKHPEAEPKIPITWLVFKMLIGIDSTGSFPIYILIEHQNSSLSKTFNKLVSNFGLLSFKMY